MNTPDTVLQIMKDQFDALYERGAEQAVLMPMTVHDFITGRPSRAKAFDDFIAYAKQHEGVVFTTHDEVRKWWLANYEERIGGATADAEIALHDTRCFKTSHVNVIHDMHARDKTSGQVWENS